MARHVWNTRRFTPGKIQCAADYLNIAIDYGYGFKEACLFVGYVSEATRQKGMTYETQIIEGAHRSKRYQNGRYRENYDRAGRNLLSALGATIGLEGAPAEVVWDYVLERGTGALE